MKKLITLLLLFTLVGFLSGNQVVITNDYEYIVSEGKTYNFNNGSESNNVKYDRTNKIAIQNNKILADPLKYHYAFFWDEADTFIGYYKTNKGITTSGEYLGQVNTQSIPLPLNAYSFALVRYDNDYVLVDGLTIEDIFIDSDNYFDNTKVWNALNNQTTNEVFLNNNELSSTFYLTSLSFFEDVFFSFPVDIYFAHSFINKSPVVANRITRLTTNVFLSTDNFDSFLGTINSTFSPPQGRVTINYLNDGSLNEFYLVFIDVDDLGLTSLTQTQFDDFFKLYVNIEENNFIYTDGYATTFINPTYVYDEKILNLTSIFGAGNEPDEATMDGYYQDYEEYLEYLYVCCDIFATQTISFETIYFDDGVSTEIEQLGSILIFTLIGFTLMIFGFASKRRIFNLLAVGAFVVLGFLLIEFVGFIIILFGLIFVNVYYTFFGEL
jgi:hypothetical protein